MKALYISFLIFIFWGCNSSSEKLSVVKDSDVFYNYDLGFTDYKNCDSISRFAENEFKKGFYRIISKGLVLPPEKYFNDSTSINDYSDKENFRFHYFLSKHNIEKTNGGCLIFKEEKCYLERMRELMSQKFDSTFWSKENKIADSLYYANKELNPKYRKDFINIYYVYPRYLISTEANSAYGLDEYIFRVSQKIKSLHLNFDKFLYPTLNLILYIDEHGKIFRTSFSLIGIDIPLETRKTIESIILKSKPWKPAILWGFPVKSEKQIEIQVM